MFFGVFQPRCWHVIPPALSESRLECAIPSDTTEQRTPNNVKNHSTAIAMRWETDSKSPRSVAAPKYISGNKPKRKTTKTKPAEPTKILGEQMKCYEEMCVAKQKI
eukprot:c20576_g1_i11.p4 GENE.c20576_g1_i11~~c20576_g1_i11.p4  ORF type:complete len:106 (-),score=20.50 c20576_g1_i11:1762-2079(-)